MRVELLGRELCAYIFRYARTQPVWTTEMCPVCFYKFRPADRLVLDTGERRVYHYDCAKKEEKDNER